MTMDETLYLPKSACELIGKVGERERHPGLQFDKLCWAAKQEKQKSAIDGLAKCEGEQDLLDSLLERRDVMLEDLSARRFRGRTVGALTLQLAHPNALENAGIALHPVYGFAWLPGTGLKGMTRAWVESFYASSVEIAPKKEAAFGSTTKAGRIVFHDAWPCQWPEVCRDIVNPHHCEYYRDDREKKPPDDRKEPIPAFFPVIAQGTEFDFALSDRSDVQDGLLEQVESWMLSALENGGIGAKTAAGYGRIKSLGLADAGQVAQLADSLPKSLLSQRYSLSLVSPAFLAGAQQDDRDCDLRVASLRGQLRWWWRTIHANHLDIENLARLEAAIWGSTQRGSAVSLSLQAGQRNKPPAAYNKKDIGKNSNLPQKQTGKTVQGLFYVSYGMDESGQRRFCRQPSDSWDLTLTAQASCWPPNGNGKKIPVDRVMQQVEAALWLLTQYGAVGSKSRKGFGSFEDLDIKGIASLEDCLEKGRDIRHLCGLTEKSGTGTAALGNRIGPVEIRTLWKDPWFALDRVGTVYQKFVKEQAGKNRAILGLPRRNYGDERLASPALFSLARNNKDCLTVRLIALPDAQCTGADRKLLEEMTKHVETELKQEVQRNPDRGKKIHRPPPLEPPQKKLEGGQPVTAELLEKKTKKGKWMAREISTGLEGPVQNSSDVPSDKKAGNRIDLFMANSTDFLWPTDEVKARLAKSQQQKNKPGRRR